MWMHPKGLAQTVKGNSSIFILKEFNILGSRLIFFLAEWDEMIDTALMSVR